MGLLTMSRREREALLATEGDACTDASPVQGVCRVSIKPTRWMTANFAKRQ